MAGVKQRVHLLEESIDSVEDIFTNYSGCADPASTMATAQLALEAAKWEKLRVAMDGLLENINTYIDFIQSAMDDQRLNADLEAEAKAAIGRWTREQRRAARNFRMRCTVNAQGAVNLHRASEADDDRKAATATKIVASATGSTPRGDDDDEDEDRAKLKPLEVPVFTAEGSMTFSTWWQTFISLIHERKGMSAINKFRRLIVALRGEPLTLVNHFIINADNYPLALKILKATYGKTEDDEKILLAKLEQLPAIVNAGYFRRFQREMEAILGQMEAEGMDVNSIHVLRILERKATNYIKMLKADDNEARQRNIEKVIAKLTLAGSDEGDRQVPRLDDSDSDDDLTTSLRPMKRKVPDKWGVPAFREAMRNMARKMGVNYEIVKIENSNPHSSSSYSNPGNGGSEGRSNTDSSSRDERGRSSYRENHFSNDRPSSPTGKNNSTPLSPTPDKKVAFKNPEPVQAFAMREKAESRGEAKPLAARRLLCFTCDGNHKMKQCPKFTNPEAKREELKRRGRCLTCGSRGHKAHECKVKADRCKDCKEKNRPDDHLKRMCVYRVGIIASIYDEVPLFDKPLLTEAELWDKAEHRTFAVIEYDTSGSAETTHVSPNSDVKQYDEFEYVVMINSSSEKEHLLSLVKSGPKVNISSGGSREEDFFPGAATHGQITQVE